MNREPFGDWGRDLADLEFARAIVRAGLSHKWPPTVDSINERAFDSPNPVVHWRWALPYGRPPEVPAGAFAEDWRRIEPQIVTSRFEVSLWADAKAALANAVFDAFKLVGISSAFLPLPDHREYSGDWQWPIRIASIHSSGRVLPLAAYQPWAWMSPLVDLVPPVSRSAFDILIVLGDLQELAEAVTRLRAPCRAHLLLAVDMYGRESSFEWTPALKSAVTLTRARGVLSVTTADFVGWFTSLIRELAHNDPLDVAVWRTHDAHRLSPGRVKFWTSRSLLRDSQVGTCAQRVARQFAGLEHLRITLPAGTRSQLGLSPVPATDPVGTVMASLSANLPRIAFAGESDGATVTSEVARAVRLAASTSREHPMSPERASRFLQAEVRSWTRGAFDDRLDGFEPGEHCVVVVFVGPPRERGAARFSPSFPDDELPPDELGHQLTVVLFDSTFMDAPLLKTIYLPPTGESDHCTFAIRLPSEARVVHARITLLHENRVLQTAVLRIPVGENGRRVRPMERQSAQTPERDASQRTGVAYDLTTEGAVSTATDALGVRSRFDAALVLNKRDDIPGALIVGGLTTAYIRLDQGLIDAAVRQINGLLQRSDWDQQTFAGLDAAGTTDLLRDLAYAGRHLYETIILQFARQFAPDEIKRLQVVAAKASAQLPVEFIYERQPPSQHARLCWNAREALERGECLGSCPSDDVNPSPVICPLAFWCNSRVIEWHAYSETRASSLGNAPFAFESDNTPRGKAIRLLHNPVLGYSAKVTDADPASIGRVTGALAAGASPIQTVVRWSDWQKAIASQSPTLVILLVHCEQDGVRELIELGPEEGLTSDKNEMKASLFLTRDDFVGATAPTPPIVLLLGCSTGSSRIQFQSLASVVAARGPAIVVSTLSDIYGPRAADLAADFLRAFAATGSSATFGDVMLDVRRKSLGSGNPMVLCLRAYGDADWALESA